MRVVLRPLILLLSPVLAMAADPADVESLIEADRQFAADVAEYGARAGFLRHLIEESVVFRPLPVSARTWFEEQDEPPFTLQWQPRWVEVADSGDFAYTVGVWASLPLAAPDLDADDDAFDAEPPETLAALGQGYYMTVWIRSAEGRWHPLADHGIGGVPTPPLEELELRESHGRSPAISGSFQLNTRYQGLMRNALRLPAAQAANAVERTWLADNLLVLRSGQMPIEGHEAVRAVASGEVGVSEPALMVMAASGDLGMSLGGEPESGAYLRLWRHDEARGWLLAVEVATPVAQAEASE